MFRKLLSIGKLSKNLLSQTNKMEITAANFKQRLPEIENAIESATFVSIDGEFTGLNAYRGISPFDTPAERYDKVKESVRQFLLIQFGLSTFHFDKSSNSYLNRTYNFYVWPRPCSRNAPDPRFLCQTSSIDFLINQNFDFNKLFRSGISYLRPSELLKLTDSLKERQEVRRQSLHNQNQENGGSLIPIPEDQEQFMKDVHQQIQNFMAGEDIQMELGKCNGFQRKLIYQTAKEKYKDLSLSSITNSHGDRVILVVKADEEEQERLAGERDGAELSDLEAALGFTQVINKISESGKLVVGHNMILDLAQTINQFCGSLPESYQDFKFMAAEVFPRILDTKLMANTIPFKQEIFNSSLEELHKAVQSSPYTLPKVEAAEAGLGYDADSERFHEAGYDAYITGLCFIAMANRLGDLCLASDKQSSKAHNNKSQVLPDSPLLSPFYNKLYLMKIADIPYMNLTGEDLKPERSHVFHVQFPKEWKTSDIIHLFSPFGHVFISWVDDCSAFVSLKDRDWSNQVLNNFKSGDLTYRVQSYDDFIKSKENNVVTSQNTGITPTLESVPFNLPPRQDSFGDSKKRPLSEEKVVTLKRHKSVNSDDSDKKKVESKHFDEPNWD